MDERPADTEPTETPTERPRQVFRARHRLQHAREFQSVYGAKVRQAGGPLVVFCLPNGLDHARLGLSVGRRVGNAVVRNRVKRMLREAFRLDLQELPSGFDLVVTVRPHTPLPLESYRRLLQKLAHGGAKQWARRARREARDV